MLHQTTTLYYVQQGSATFPANQFTGKGGVGHTDPEIAQAHAKYCQEHIYNGHQDHSSDFVIRVETVCASTMEVPAYEALNDWVLVKYWLEGGIQKRLYVSEEGIPTSFRNCAKRFLSIEEAYQWKQSPAARDGGPFDRYEAVYM